MEFQENSKQNSLTSPSDLDKTQPKSFDVRRELTDSEAEAAFKELNVTDFVDKFPRFEKFYSDPQIPNQTYGLLSWTPAKGCTPDKEGVYGMVKLRGNFSNQQEADLHAERLIKTCDSYHSIYQCYVGKPFPLSSSKKYISETKEIDVKKKITEATSEQVRANRNQEADTIKEIESKQKELLEDTSKSEEDKNLSDPLELYTETMVKKAQLVWTYHNTLKKMEQMKTSIIGARRVISKMDSENPEYKKEYMERYMEARRKSNLPATDQSFLKYMGEDLDLGF